MIKIISNFHSVDREALDESPLAELSTLECRVVAGGQGFAGLTRLNKGKSTFPHKGTTTVGSPFGTCGENMSCPEPEPEPDSGGGICGVNMSCQ